MANKSKIVMRNWDPEARYRFGIGLGFYFNGKRVVVRKGETVTIDAPVEPRMRLFHDNVNHLLSEARNAQDATPLVIIDDQSPVEPDVEALAEIAGDNPFLYFRLPKNLGCGGKENILQRLLSERCEYVARCDDDVTLDPFDFDEVLAGLAGLDNAFAVTSCITYFARLDAANQPEDQRHFSGSNMADFVIYKSTVFDHVGYSDPMLRSNDDGELRLRIQGALDWRIFVDKMLTGKAPPSGAGAGLEKRRELGRYVQATRPFITVVFPKEGTPRYRLNKKQAAEARLFYVPAHPWAQMMLPRIWT